MCASNVYLAHASLNGKPFAEAWKEVMTQAALDANLPALDDNPATGPLVT